MPPFSPPCDSLDGPFASSDVCDLFVVRSLPSGGLGAYTGRSGRRLCGASFVSPFGEAVGAGELRSGRVVRFPLPLLSLGEELGIVCGAPVGEDFKLRWSAPLFFFSLGEGAGVLVLRGMDKSSSRLKGVADSSGLAVATGVGLAPFARGAAPNAKAAIAIAKRIRFIIWFRD
ncbi:MAG: hypothetical protein ACXWHF_07140 [Chthoniobacterales bacterium]